MFGPQAFFMNKQLKINKGFFTAILSAFSDLDASIDRQIELRDKESQLLPLMYFTCSVSYTHLRAHETRGNLVCRLLLEKKKNKKKKKKKIKKKKKKKIFFFFFFNDTATTEIYTE